MPFTPGRVRHDAGADRRRDVRVAEAGRRRLPQLSSTTASTTIAQGVAPEEMFLDKANLLSLTAPEWVALDRWPAGAGRATTTAPTHGIFTDRAGVLTNDFFTVLTSMDYEWKKADPKGMTFMLDDRETGENRFTATRSDLVFGSNASCAPSPKSTPAATATSASSRTSSRPGTRS